VLVVGENGHHAAAGRRSVAEVAMDLLEGTVTGDANTLLLRRYRGYPKADEQQGHYGQSQCSWQFKLPCSRVI
jgi:hypothetical protein